MTAMKCVLCLMAFSDLFGAGIGLFSHDPAFTAFAAGNALFLAALIALPIGNRP
jgi:hypothetical protein